MPATSTSPLSLAPVAQPASEAAYAELVQDILASSSLLSSSLLDSTDQTWKWGKTYRRSYSKPNGEESPVIVRTASASHPPGTGDDNTKWFARVSTHKDATYDGFVEGLLKNHSPNEAAYIEDCTEAKLLSSIAEGELAQYRMSYHLPAPTSNREFCILILTKDISPPAGPRKFQVVTVPTEHPDAPKGRRGSVRGRYASVEEVEELEGGGVEWRMATVSNPGGLVPQWIAELAMPSKITEDVPSFLSWIESNPFGAK